MTEIQTMRRVDWWRIVCDLQRKGYTHVRIGKTIGVSHGTVDGWKNKNAEPKHEVGERLLRFWCITHCLPRDDAPLI